ncbi:MAG: sarcosine oxidase subunit gamma [Hyphomicrobium sp.]
MSEPAMQSPLHAFGLPTLAKPADASAGVWASEVPLLGYIGLRGGSDNPVFVEAASRALGLALPTTACVSAQTDATIALWLSPDEWLIVCPRSELSRTLADLRQSLAGIRSQVVDISGGYTKLVVQGRNAADVMRNVSVYNFETLAEGRVVGTTFGKASAYICREGQGFCLVIRRSFADYIWRYLVRAAEPYGFGVVRLPDTSRAAS